MEDAMLDIHKAKQPPQNHKQTKEPSKYKQNKKEIFLGKEMEMFINLYSALWLFVSFGTFLSLRDSQMQLPAEKR